MKTKHDLNMILLFVINTELVGSTYFLIAQKILENLDNLRNISIKELANLCDVSTSTISRFCKHINLSGFVELRFLINQYRNTAIEKFYIPGYDSTEISLTDFIDFSSESLLSIKDSVDEKEVDEIARNIVNADNIIIAGILQSGNIALNVQYSLTTLGIIAKTLTNPYSYDFNFSTFKDNTYVLIFSKSGSLASDLIKHVPMFREEHFKIGMITENKNFRSNKFISDLINLEIDFNISTEGIAMNVIANYICLKCFNILAEN